MNIWGLDRLDLATNSMNVPAIGRRRSRQRVKINGATKLLEGDDVGFCSLDFVAGWSCRGWWSYRAVHFRSSVGRYTHARGPPIHLPPHPPPPHCSLRLSFF